MLNLGWFGFANPWLLTALVALPALWWLLRVIPPAPRRIRFPAVRFLFGLEPDEPTSARTPPWLLILRMVLAALLILALARPVLNPEPEVAASGPLILVLDDGWAATVNWEARLDALARYAERAERDNREIVLLTTAPDALGPHVRRMSAADFVALVPSLQPKPWPVDRAAAREALQAEGGLDDAEVVWLSDGIARDPADLEAVQAFADGLHRIGPLIARLEPPEDRSLLLSDPVLDAGALVVTASRPAPGPLLGARIRALGPEGEVLARTPLVFEPGSRRAEARFELPLELQNRIARIELEPRDGVGGVVLLDERWRQRVVGLVGETSAQTPQPLLSELYYVERALNAHAQMRLAPVAELLDGPISAIVLPDSASWSARDEAALLAWIEAGGVVIRFAGPTLAQAEADPLVPVRLRRGDRNLEGALTWARPLPLASFDERGPLAGLSVPADDVLVRRQVLAEPGPQLADRTWARLADGTPLITGAPRGDGWLVLVHTTANTAWSSLPLSGVFVDMLQRMVALGTGAGFETERVLVPVEVLDGRGQLVEPGPAVQPLEAGMLDEAIPGPVHPPGLYGALEAGDEAARRALNLAAAVPDPRAIGALQGVEALPYAGSDERDLLPLLLVLALLLALADMVIALALRGLLPRFAPAAVALLVLVPQARAEVDEESMLQATDQTHLAYVVTGMPEIDAQSLAGLEGLSLVLSRRTAIETGDPVPVDLDQDDLNLFPLLYWPVRSDHPEISAETRGRIEHYLRQGGMILFDTGDAGVLVPGQPGPGPGEQRLRQLLAGVKLPPLEPVPEDHTLTRSFYLLQDFPGRWTGRPVWVDRVEASVNDGVSSVIIGGNDWAGAWAISEYGMPILPVVPGGERQREMANRFGVNLVMYALTGNYKTDQVHIPALLERLGQ